MMDAGLRSGQSPQVKIVNTCSSPPQRCSLPSKRGGGAPTAVSTPLSLFGLACSATPFPLRRTSKRSQVVIPQKAGTGSGTWSTFQDLILFHWLDPCIKRRGPSVIPPRRRRSGLRASAINRTPHTSHFTPYTSHCTLRTSALTSAVALMPFTQRLQAHDPLFFKIRTFGGNHHHDRSFCITGRSDRVMHHLVSYQQGPEIKCPEPLRSMWDLLHLKQS